MNCRRGCRGRPNVEPGPGSQWSRGRSRGDVYASAAGANGSSAAMEPASRVTEPSGSFCFSVTLPDSSLWNRSPGMRQVNFGTAVRVSGFFFRGSAAWRRISWRAQIPGEAKAFATPADPSTLSSTRRTAAEDSTGVGVGDLYARVGRVVSGARPASSRQIAISSHGDYGRRRAWSSQGTDRHARHRKRDCTSRDCRSACTVPLSLWVSSRLLHTS
jgi:hypothetical protein